MESFPGVNLCPIEYRPFLNQLMEGKVYILQACEVVNTVLCAIFVHKPTGSTFNVNISTLAMGKDIVNSNRKSFIRRVTQEFIRLSHETCGKKNDDVECEEIEESEEMAERQEVNVISSEFDFDKLFDGLDGDFKSRVVCVMKEQGIHDIRLLFGNVNYMRQFCKNVGDEGTLAAKIFFRRLTGRRLTEKSTAMKFVTDNKGGFLGNKVLNRSVDDDDVTFYNPVEIKHFRRNHPFLKTIDRFRILGYNEEGEVDPNSDFICVKPSYGNSVTIFSRSSKLTLRIPGIYSVTTTPLQFVTEKFSFTSKMTNV